LLVPEQRLQRAKVLIFEQVGPKKYDSRLLRKPTYFDAVARAYAECAVVFLEGSRVFGKVKWFNKVEGYGFIGQTDGPDVFVHYSSMQGLGYRSLSEGDKVEFQTVQGAEGPQAINVRRPGSDLPEEETIRAAGRRRRVASSV
jgi:cold shock protein